MTDTLNFKKNADDPSGALTFLSVVFGKVLSKMEPKSSKGI